MHTTDVSPANKNYRRCGWNQIVDRNRIFSVFDGMRMHPTRRTSSGERLLDADRRPRWLLDLDEHEVETLVGSREQEADPLGRITNGQ